MKLTRLWQQNQKPTISFEFFPARSAKAAADFDVALEELLALQPDFVSVTFGAGGSTREGSRQLVARLAQEKPCRVIGYLAAYGLSPAEIDEVLVSYRQLGVENILAVRGDAPAEPPPDWTPHPEAFTLARDLVAYIHPRYDFCLGVAGYPEGHKDAPSLEADLNFLKQKIEAGAGYVIANYCYDTGYFTGFQRRCRAAGLTVPVLPGIMPVYTVKMMENLCAICGASIPEAIRQELAGLPPGDKEALLEYGISLAVRQGRELLAAGAPGLHFYTMDRSRSVVEIIRRLRREGCL